VHGVRSAAVTIKAAGLSCRKLQKQAADKLSIVLLIIGLISKNKKNKQIGLQK